MALKHCKEVRFSNGGHYFACAIGINVMVFPTYVHLMPKEPMTTAAIFCILITNFFLLL